MTPLMSFAERWNISMKEITPDKSWRHYDKHYKVVLDSNWYKNIAIIEDILVAATFDFFKNKNFATVCVPITTNSISSPMGLGSDSKPVKVKIDGVNTYLADSMQFYLEYYLRILGKNVHYIMPSFRGEESDERHLSQFYHSEAEMFGELGDVILIVNEYITKMCEDILKKAEDLICSMAGNIKHIERLLKKNKKFSLITFEDAVNLLTDTSGMISQHNGYRTITSSGEKRLLEYFDGIVWLTNHDYLSVPFYQARQGEFAKNADLLLGIGEVVGCGERCYSHKDVLESLNTHNVEVGQYKWYLYMKEHSLVKTSGFGLGLERFLLFLLKHDDIRDMAIIPRFNGTIIEP